MEKEKNSEIIQIAANIRKIRKQQKISLEKMAKGTDLSISFLSLMECSKANISVENLKKITDFLGIEMINLFEVQNNQKLGTVTKKGEGFVLKIEKSNIYCESLIRSTGTALQSTFYKTPPNEDRKIANSHIGDELVYIISGEVNYYLNNQTYHLQEGDLMHYRSEAQHSWTNPGNIECVMIVVNTPPNW